MNYNKLQLSFILLLAMSTIHLLLGLLLLKKLWLVISSLIAMGLCISGIVFSLRQEQREQEKKREMKKEQESNQNL